MTPEQLARIDRIRDLYRRFSSFQTTTVSFRACLKAVGDLLEILDDQMKKLAALVKDVDAYRAGKGVRAHLVKAREENAGLRAQIHDLEAYCFQLHKELDDASQKAAVLDRLRGSEPHIRADDVVLHRPTGVGFVVCGVSNHGGHRLIPCGNPFPCEVDTADCDLIQCREGGQPEAYKDKLRRHGLESFIEPEPVKESPDSGADAPEQATDADT